MEALQASALPLGYATGNEIMQEMRDILKDLSLKSHICMMQKLLSMVPI